MLESLRAVQNTRAGKTVLGLIMGLIMLSFVIWGIGPVFTGFNANQIASVGGQSITTEAFRTAYQNELYGLQQRTRQQITNAQAHQYGLDTQVLSRMVSEAVLDNQAQSLGLAISNDQIAKQIIADPAFKGPNGQFDRGQFNAMLGQMGATEQNFVRDQRAVYLRQELIQGLVGNMSAPSAPIEVLNRFRTETRSVDYITVPASAVGALPPADEAVLKKFFDDRAQSYRSPEYRKLVILPLLPTALAKPDEISDADVQALYDRVKDARYTTPEYRTLQQIVFPNEADAAAASERIKAGTSFANIATERKLTDKDTDLGRVTKDSMFDKAIAEAAFGLPQNGVSPPIKNAFGAVLVHVTGIEPGQVKPLAAVTPELRADLAASRAGDAVRVLSQKVDDARSSGQSLTQAAKAAGTEARTIDAVDQNGKDRDGKAVENLPDAAALLKAAFASDVGVDNDPVQVPGGGQVLYEVASVDAARPQSFAEVRPRIEAAWREDETAKLLAAKGAELVKQISGGQTIEQVAASVGNLPVQHANDVRRQGTTGLSPSTVAQVFNVHVGEAGSAPGDDENRIVFKVLGSVVPPVEADSPQVKQLETQYKTWLAEDMIEAYLRQAEGRLGVKINPAAFNNAVGGSS